VSIEGKIFAYLEKSAIIERVSVGLGPILRTLEHISHPVGLVFRLANGNYEMAFEGD
jgi:hypothetical protein